MTRERRRQEEHGQRYRTPHVLTVRSAISAFAIASSTASDSIDTVVTVAACNQSIVQDRHRS